MKIFFKINDGQNWREKHFLVTNMFAFLGDTASNLGNAMDELMRHQPSLRADATKAIIKVSDDQK